jgi:hypothetical protein
MIRKPLSILLLAAALLAGCAKEPLKQAGLQGESTIGAVRDLVASYERRDLDAFLDRVAPGYPDRDGLRKRVENVFGAFQTIAFKVQYQKAVITVQHKGNIKAVFTWEGEWRTGGGRVVKDGARVTLVFDAAAYKLVEIEGKNPFIPAEGTGSVKP